MSVGSVPCVYNEGWGGKWLLTVSLFLEGFLMNAASLGHSLRRATNLPTVCPMRSSDCCFHTVGLLAVCPAFSLKVAPMSSKFSHSQAGWPLKLQALRLSCFPSQLLQGFIFPTGSLCASSSLGLLSRRLQIPPHCSNQDPFLSQVSSCISYLLLCGLWSTFSCGLCSDSLQINSWGIWDDLILI